jgi:hypothetical protein
MLLIFLVNLISKFFDLKRFKFEDIHLIAPSMKLKLAPIPEMKLDEKKDELKIDLKDEKKKGKKKGKEDVKVEEVVENADVKVAEGPVKMSYKQGKEFAIKKCASLLDEAHKTYLLTHKKKDDLCDCYLQAYHYLTKIKKILIV